MQNHVRSDDGKVMAKFLKKAGKNGTLRMDDFIEAVCQCDHWNQNLIVSDHVIKVFL